MNVHRHIAGLLLFCFSVYLGHNLVPHHHLSDNFYTPVTTACPLEHGDLQGHGHPGDHGTGSDQHPSHCHAFNDLVFDKFSPAAITPLPCQLHDMAVPSRVTAPAVSSQLLAKVPIFLNQSGISRTDMGARGLRAPPVFG